MPPPVQAHGRAPLPQVWQAWSFEPRLQIISASHRRGDSASNGATHFNLDGQAKVCEIDSGPARTRGRPFNKTVDSEGFELVRGGYSLGDLPIKRHHVSQKAAMRAQSVRFSLHAATLAVCEQDAHGAVSSPVIAAPGGGDLPVGLPGAIGGRIEPEAAIAACLGRAHAATARADVSSALPSSCTYTNTYVPSLHTPISHHTMPRHNASTISTSCASNTYRSILVSPSPSKLSSQPGKLSGVGLDKDNRGGRTIGGTGRSGSGIKNEADSKVCSGGDRRSCVERSLDIGIRHSGAIGGRWQLGQSGIWNMGGRMMFAVSMVNPIQMVH